MAINELDLMNMSDEELDLISQNTMNIKVNRMQERMNQIEKGIKRFADKIEKIEANQELYFSEVESQKNNIKSINNELNQVKDVTYVLATDDGKRKALTKLVNSLCYKKYTDKKNSLKDKLFHKTLTKACYDRLYNQFEVNSYTRIKIDDFEEAMKVVNRWFGNEQNIKKVISKRLQEYINDEYLTESKKQMVDKFLEMTNGGTNLW